MKGKEERNALHNTIPTSKHRRNDRKPFYNHTIQIQARIYQRLLKPLSRRLLEMGELYNLRAVPQRY